MSAKAAVDASLEATLDEIAKIYGAGVISWMDQEKNKVEVIPTGVLTLDYKLGAGGLPRGRIATLYGPEGGGKSTLLMHLIAEEQKIGGTCAFIDMEYGMDPLYASAIGVDIPKTLIAQPDNGNDAFTIIDKLVETGKVSLIGVDSATAMVPRAEMEGDYGDANVGLQPRMFSQAMRKLVGKVGRKNVCLVFTAQVREKIGQLYGNPETLSGGGRALPFYSSVLIEIRRAGQPDQMGGIAVSNDVRFNIKKNRVGKPYQEAHADILYGEGFSRTGALLDMAVDLEIVQKSGSWYTYEGQQLGQGRANSKAFLAEDQITYDEIDKRVRESL